MCACLRFLDRADRFRALSCVGDFVSNSLVYMDVSRALTKAKEENNSKEVTALEEKKSSAVMNGWKYFGDIMVYGQTSRLVGIGE